MTRLLLILIASFFLQSGCKRIRGISQIQAIVDANDQHAFGFLPVSYDLPSLSQMNPATLSGGDQWAHALGTSQIYYAMIECRAMSGISAAMWFKQLEEQAIQPRGLLLDGNRKLKAFPNCYIFNNRLLTYTLLQQTILNPATAQNITPKKYSLAQAFYLALRGSYDPKDNTKTDTVKLLRSFALMMKAQKGLPAIDLDKFINDFLSMDSYYIPDQCGALQKTPPNQSIANLKNQNFACVPNPAKPNTFNFLPRMTGEYQGFVTSLGKEIDAMYEGPLSTGLNVATTPENARMEAWDFMTRLDVPINFGDIIGRRNYGGNFYLAANNSPMGTAFGLCDGCGGDGKTSPPAGKNTPPKRPSNPPPVAPSGERPPAPNNLGGPSNIVPNTPPNVPSQVISNMQIVNNSIKDMNTRLNSDRTNREKLGSTAYYDQQVVTKLNQFNQDLSKNPNSVQPISLPNNSNFVAYQKGEESFYFNKTSGEPFVFKNVTIKDEKGNPMTARLDQTAPHYGDINNAQDPKFVGLFDVKKDGKMFGELKVGEKMFEITTKEVPGGGFLYNNESLKQAEEGVKNIRKDLSDEQFNTAMKDIEYSRLHATPAENGGGTRDVEPAIANQQNTQPQQPNNPSTQTPPGGTAPSSNPPTNNAPPAHPPGSGCNGSCLLGLINDCLCGTNDSATRADGPVAVANEINSQQQSYDNNKAAYDAAVTDVQNPANTPVNPVETAYPM